MLGSLRSPRAPHIQPLSAPYPHRATYSHIQPHRATYSHQEAAGSRQMLGSLRSPRAPHIQPLSAASSQQPADPCSARSARLARPQRWPLSATSSSSSIPTVRHCPRPPPSRARSFLAVCANDCAWIIIHFGFSVLDNYSFLPLSVNNFSYPLQAIITALCPLPFFWAGARPRPPLGGRGHPTVSSKSYPLQAIISVLNGQPSAALKRSAGSLRQPLKVRKARASPPPLVCLCWLPAPPLRSAGGQPQSAGSLRQPLKVRKARASPPPLVYTLAVAKMNNYPKLKNQNE